VGVDINQGLAPALPMADLVLWLVDWSSGLGSVSTMSLDDVACRHSSVYCARSLRESRGSACSAI